VTAAGGARKAVWTAGRASEAGARAFSPQCKWHLSDDRSFAVNDRPPVSTTSLSALAAASVMTLVSTAAFGACLATLHGELVQDDRPNQLYRAVPQKLLFFSLNETAEENGYTVQKLFQSFSFPNDKMTFPIPFALDISSPRDCPKELELYVVGSHHSGFHYEYPMRGWKKINLETIEFMSVMVYPPTF
jgi:hypothetical protein